MRDVIVKSIHEVKSTDEPDVFILTCTMAGSDGEEYDCEYCSRPDDTHGLNPSIRKWLIDNEGRYNITKAGDENET